MAEPIIIVDDEGTEHEFPPGMDPKKAGRIVSRIRGDAQAAQAQAKAEEASHGIRDMGRGVLNTIDGMVGSLEALPSTLDDILRPSSEGIQRNAARGQAVLAMAKGIPSTIKRAVTGQFSPVESGELLGNVALMAAQTPTALRMGRALQHPVGQGLIGLGKGVELAGKKLPSSGMGLVGMAHSPVAGIAALAAKPAINRVGQGLQAGGKRLTGAADARALAAQQAAQPPASSMLPTGTQTSPLMSPVAGPPSAAPGAVASTTGGLRMPAPATRPLPPSEALPTGTSTTNSLIPSTGWANHPRQVPALPLAGPKPRVRSAPLVEVKAPAPTKPTAPANIRIGDTNYTPRQVNTANGILVRRGQPIILEENISNLTPGQAEVLAEVRAGRTAGEIAFKLGKGFSK